MSALKVSTFLTLDGVMQAPGDATEFDQRGLADPALRRRRRSDRQGRSSCGRRAAAGTDTYEHFAAAWPEHDG